MGAEAWLMGQTFISTEKDITISYPFLPIFLNELYRNSKIGTKPAVVARHHYCQMPEVKILQKVGVNPPKIV